MKSDEKLFKMTKGVSNPIFGIQRLIVIINCALGGNTDALCVSIMLVLQKETKFSF